ncbi:MAG: DUF4405 domain-containing protein [Bacteroidetes bacterium]|nr:DUF4405 domain-containing protein [Bacteroidota bacterium]
MIFRKSWATPLTIGSFILMSVTGILMFFHLDSQFNKVAHEYFSWAFVAGVVFHVVVNWKPFAGYFRARIALSLIGFFVLLLAFSFFSWGEKEQGGRPPVQKIVGALSTVPVTELAVIAKKDPAELIVKLKEAGFPVTTGSETVQDLTRGEKGQQGKLLGLIFE